MITQPSIQSVDIIIPHCGDFEQIGGPPDFNRNHTDVWMALLEFATKNPDKKYLNHTGVIEFIPEVPERTFEGFGRLFRFGTHQMKVTIFYQPQA